MAVTRWRTAITTAAAVLVGLVAGGIFDRTVAGLVATPAAVGLARTAVAARSSRLRLVVVAAVAAAFVTVAVVWAGGELRVAVTGVWSGPRRILTTEWPSPLDPAVVGALAVVLAAATWAATELAARPRWHLAPLVPLLVTLVLAIGLGAPVPPAGWAMALTGGSAAALALVRHRDHDRSERRLVAVDRTLVVSAAAVVLVTVVATGAIAWADRADPRLTPDADVSAALLDPIEATVALREAEPPIELYRIVDRSTIVGPSLPARWRTSALDAYDGQRWVPRLTLRPIGGRLGLAPPPSFDAVPPIRYDLTLLTDDLDALPFPGRPLSVDADVETDVDRVVVRLADAPTPGTVVAAQSEVAPPPSAARTSPVGTRQVDDLSGVFRDRAAALAGDGTVIEQLRAIEETMRTEWRLDSAAPGGGHQLALIERFVIDTQRGTREQFVTAFVLLARALGYDARVAVGYVVPPDEVATPLTLRSTHAAVWPEVRLESAGWLAFDPVPAAETTDGDEPTPPPQAQSPAAAQPPIAPPSDDRGDVDDEVVEIDDGAGRWASLRTWIVRVAAVSTLALLPVATAIFAILTIKWWRRRRRRRLSVPALRVRGAWANTTDSLVDAGLTIGPAWTDDRIAIAAAPLAPGTPHELRRLATMAAGVTFGPTDDAHAWAADAVHTADAVDAAIRAARSRWQRVRWRLSLRSLRRSTRSPIVVPIRVAQRA